MMCFFKKKEGKIYFNLFLCLLQPCLMLYIFLFSPDSLFVTNALLIFLCVEVLLGILTLTMAIVNFSTRHEIYNPSVKQEVANEDSH